MMYKVKEVLALIGNLSSLVNTFILMGLVITVYVITHSEDADLFSSPIVYLGANISSRGNLYYTPANGDEFCLGEEILWDKAMRFIRSTRINRSYYLQIERPFSFTGPQAKELTEKYGPDLLTTIGLYSIVTPSTHVIEGFFDGGLQSFLLPKPDELRPHNGIKPGDHLRLYVDVEAPSSQANGYYVPFIIGPNCPVIEATAIRSTGDLINSFTSAPRR